MPKGLRGFQKGNKLGKKFVNYGKLKDVICRSCGLWFQRYESELKRVNNSFCSKKCIQYIPRFSRRNRVEKKCLICKKRFEVINYRKDISFFCSKKCYGISMLSPVRSNEQQFYASEKWRKTRQKVYKRDKYKCQKCGNGKESGKRVAHHIEEIRKNPRTKWLDTKKIITLCITCHNFIHKKFIVSNPRKTKV